MVFGNYYVSKFLLFADDLKPYMPVLTVVDCTKLQQDLDQFQLWCMNKSLNINMNKCSQITFTSHNKNIISQYYINNSKLDKVATVKDLGITFLNILMFTEYIIITCNRGLRVFGFLKQNCSTTLRAYEFIIFHLCGVYSGIWVIDLEF